MRYFAQSHLWSVKWRKLFLIPSSFLMLLIHHHELCDENIFGVLERWTQNVIYRISIDIYFVIFVIFWEDKSFYFLLRSPLKYENNLWHSVKLFMSFPKSIKISHFKNSIKSIETLWKLLSNIVDAHKFFFGY
jgi:hypothetical protein